MTPQEKAKELFDAYRIVLIQSETEAGEEILCISIAKQCALKLVDKIINESEENDVDDFYSDQGYYIDNLTYKVLGYNEYWQEVKQQIEKL